MPTALQLPPTRDKPATPAGPRTWRKQVLPVGRLKAGDRDLKLDAAMLDQIVASFNAGAYDMVPVVLADGANRHSDDPLRVRGQVTALERAPDGLHATVQTTDQGARLLTDHPNLPVSARLIPPESEPAPGRWCLAHLCLTLDPAAKGLRRWEAVDASAGLAVVDLTSCPIIRDTDTTPTKERRSKVTTPTTLDAEVQAEAEFEERRQALGHGSLELDLDRDDWIAGRAVELSRQHRALDLTNVYDEDESEEEAVERRREWAERAKRQHNIF